MKVDHSEAISQADLLEANPSAPHSVNPMAPIRFQKPMCQPSTVGAGVYQLFWVSSMKSQLEMMKPVPPTTWCGWSKKAVSQYCALTRSRLE